MGDVASVLWIWWQGHPYTVLGGGVPLPAVLPGTLSAGTGEGQASAGQGAAGSRAACARSAPSSARGTGSDLRSRWSWSRCSVSAFGSWAQSPARFGTSRLSQKLP